MAEDIAAGAGNSSDRRNWDHAAGILWPALVTAAGERRTVFYDELSPLIDTNPLNVGRALGPIQEYCLDHRLPPLTAIVIGKTSRVPGGGFVAWDVADLPHALTTVYDRDWASIANPYAAFGPQISRTSLAERICAAPESAGDVYRLVKDRGVAQTIFKLALSDAYDGVCAFCGLSFPQALEGAHIVRWPDCTQEQKVDVRNGLLLCATHHLLFDRAVMTVTTDFHVEYCDPSGSDGVYSVIDKEISSKLHGKRLNLPIDPNLWPDFALIAQRRQVDGW